MLPSWKPEILVRIYLLSIQERWVLDWIYLLLFRKHWTLRRIYLLLNQKHWIPSRIWMLLARNHGPEFQDGTLSSRDSTSCPASSSRFLGIDPFLPMATIRQRYCQRSVMWFSDSTLE